MSTDIHLRLERRRKLFLKRHRAIAIAAPLAKGDTEAGTYSPPPTELWGATSGYARGDIDVERLGDWLVTCIGQPILGVIRELYPTTGEEDMRVLMTAEDDLRPELISMPWELLESRNKSQDLPLAEHLAVVRVLTTESGLPPVPAGQPLRVAILWANPRADIPDLSEHLKDLERFVEELPADFSLIGVVEFTNTDEVLKQLAEKRVDIVYHIGHGYQPRDQTVQLLIGPKGAPTFLDVERFKALLAQIGPPRLLLLNACAATVGHQLNPYLGAALRLVQNIEAVIAMQTMVPVNAAIPFASEFFRGLAAGCGLASSLKRGRKKIMSLERPGCRSFDPYIPVLFQQTVQDKLFEIDLTGRALRQVLGTLRRRIERVEPYLDRTHDPGLLKLLQTPLPNRRVSIVSGPRNSGKSTSIRRAISSLTNEKEYRAGNRWLYYDVVTAKLPIGTGDIHVYDLLIAFANALPTTDSLRRQLSGSRDPQRGIPVLANWLYEEERDGRNTCICLDNLDPALAEVLAKQSANAPIEAGSLLLVTEQHSLPSDAPINPLSIAMMSPAEVRASLQEHGLPFDEVAGENAIRFSNGLPYFVAGYILKPNPSENMKELAANLVARYQPGPSAEQRQILQFTSLCGVPVPGPLLEKLFPATDIDALVKEYPFLRQTEAETYLIPDALRKYWSESAPENQTELHRTAFAEFHALGEAQASSWERSTYQRTTAWYREAFEHGCVIAKALARDAAAALEVLDETRGIAEKLHDRYLLGNEIAACVSLWEQFREVEHSFDLYDDRSADAHYAECLMKAGKDDEADEILDQVVVGDQIDRIQLNALFLRSNLIKSRGKSEYPLRIELLRAALEVAHQLEKHTEEKDWAKRQVAELEYSLGNALGYGKDADPAKAIEHLARAHEILDELGDFGYAFFRTISEQIEIKRYNGLLSPDERQEAIETLSENVRHLVTRDMQLDAVMHLYELGRLSEDPAQRAQWFERAFRRAADNFEPRNWHAAIRWCIARVEAQPQLFDTVAPELEGYAGKLVKWQNRAWSRRVRRNALKFLAETYARLTRTPQALAAAKSCWEVVLSIQQLGEGRKDAGKRLETARLYGSLLAREGLLADARSIAAAIAPDVGLDPAEIAVLDQTELEKLFFVTTAGSNL